jgi:phosphopantothenoylcysteine decarboxylase / phosphopantothenate---cysteine ligase
VAIARAAALRGGEVHLVYANISVSLPYYLKEAISASTAAEMKKAVDKLAPKMDIIIMAAAVSDFTPVKTSKDKIKKSAKLSLELTQTPDILAELGKNKKPKQKLIGFAAETENINTNAKAKLEKKNLDLIVANHLNVSGQGATEITLITRKTSKTLAACKFHAANLILDKIKTL